MTSCMLRVGFSPHSILGVEAKHICHTSYKEWHIFRSARSIWAAACYLPKVGRTTSPKLLYARKGYFSSCEVRNHCIWHIYAMHILCIASPLVYFLFIFRVAKEEAHNRMSTSALAIVFAPCILRCPDSSDPLLSMKDINKTTLWESFFLFVFFMIRFVWFDLVLVVGSKTGKGKIKIHKLCKQINC